MENTRARKRRPFQETIVDAISRAPATEMDLLSVLIKQTSIRSNHDNIIAAWKERLRELVICGYRDDDRGVPEDLLVQKQAAEEKKHRRDHKAILALQAKMIG